jgi:ABC-type sugar transport system ATPase subunit
MSEAILEMRNISKSFPGVKALDRVSFDLRPGEIHALIGENGAGKSTLIKCLGGLHMPEEGEIIIDGKKVDIINAKVSRDHGIGIIYQEFNLVPAFSIAENIYLGREYMKNGMIDRAGMFRDADEILRSLGQENMSSKTPVFKLSTSQQQMIEICKAVSANSKIVVFDEPTAVLTQKETLLLFDIIARLKSQGVGIIYITHRLDEVLQLSDRITALRDGVVTRTVDNGPDVTKDDLVAMMVGRKLDAYYPARSVQPSEDIVMEVKNFSYKSLFSDVNIKLHRGEILGVCGLVGAGRTETMKSIFGVLPHDTGEVFINGKKVEHINTHELIKHGMVLLPEDRKNEGLSLMQTAAINLCIPNFDQISKSGLINSKMRSEFVNKFFNLLSVRPPLPNRLAVHFSGGNQQKLIIAKWLARNPHILVMDEPTRGIDVNAKAEVYNIINDLTTKGMSIIMISSEMAELMGVCDRIMVMYEGRFIDEFTRDEFDEQNLARAQSGIRVH